MSLDAGRFLVVVEGLALRKQISGFLRDRRADVQVASSLSEARRLPIDGLDVSLVSVELRDGTGIDLMHELEDRAPDSEVVLVTGSGTVPNAARAVDDGAFGYVLAPIEPLGFGASVEAALRQVRITRELREKDVALRLAQRHESVARLVQEVAHDFNNLLSVIRGYARAVDQADQSEERHRYADAIHDCTRRGAALTRQLLCYGRRNAGKPRPILMNSVLEDLTGLWEHVLGADVNIVLDLEVALGRVQGDVGQLEQVLMNLAINARDAMPSGGELGVSSSSVVLDERRARELHIPRGRYACISVADTGDGMDEETLRQALLTFFTTKGEKGTGLGLSTASSIVREHGGALELRSVPGRGTCADVYLPLLAESDHPRVIVESERAPAEANVPPNAGRANVGQQDTGLVLLVEDEDVLRLAARTCLEEEGRYEVAEAATIAAAIDMVFTRKLPLEILLTDLRLPDGRGTDLARRLLRALPDLHVVIMTGMDDVQDENGCVVLKKPFDLEDLPGILDGVRSKGGPAKVRPPLVPVDDARAAPFGPADPLDRTA